MTKNRNWQSRVEVAAQLRRETQQRKQRADEQRQAKMVVQQQFRQMDRHHDAILLRMLTTTTNNNTVLQQQPLLHIWTHHRPVLSGNQDGSNAAAAATTSTTTAADREDSWMRAPSPSSSSCVMHPRRAPRNKSRSVSWGGSETGCVAEYYAPPPRRGSHTRRRRRSQSTTEDPQPHDDDDTVSSSPITTTTTTSSDEGKTSKKLTIVADSTSSRTNDKRAFSTTTGTASSGPMCPTHFFTGHCSENPAGGGGRAGRKGTSTNTTNSGTTGCRWVHADGTLHEVLTTHRATLLRHDDCLGGTTTTTTTSPRGGDHSGQQQLEQSKQAWTAHCILSSRHGMPLLPGSMDPLVHREILLKGEGEQEGTASSTTTTISAQVSERLSGEGVPLHTVVYMVLDNVLVFDRYRQGMLFPNDKDLLLSLLGSERGALYCRKHSIGSEADESAFSAEHTAAVQSLSVGAILEHILGFLPDESVASFCRVCKLWHYEIGRNSPNLWKLLLDRHDWPHPAERVSEASKNTNDVVDIFRDQFLEHYSVIRDLKAIRIAMKEVCGSSGGKPKAATLDGSEVAYQSFASRSNAPKLPNECVELRIWSPNQVLIAYDEDCTLRLFESRPGTGRQSQCRELVCRSIDPFRNTVRLRTHILAMDLDETFIAWTCYAEGNPKSDTPDRCVIAFASREEYLLGENGNTSESGSRSSGLNNYMAIDPVDMKEMLLSYLVDQISEGVNDHVWPDFVAFVERGGDFDHVWAESPKEALCSCGHGRFLCEVHLCLDEHFIVHRMNFLVMFSANSRTIEWVQRSESTLWRAEAKFKSRTLSTGCLFAITCRVTLAVQFGEIEAFTGALRNYGTLGASTSTWTDIQRNSFVHPFVSDRPFALTKNEVIVATSWMEYNTALSFYPLRRATFEDGSLYQRLELEYLTVLRLTCIHDKYLILICRRYELAPILSQTDQNEFGLDEEYIPNKNLEALVVHVASRRVIGCVVLMDDDVANVQLPKFASDCHNTVAVDLSCRGVAMTGTDVRTLLEARRPSNQESNAILRSPNKKKKNRKVKDNSKDRFVRGISMTG